jgi:hypothetical protein
MFRLKGLGVKIIANSGDTDSKLVGEERDETDSMRVIKHANINQSMLKYAHRLLCQRLDMATSYS